MSSNLIGQTLLNRYHVDAFIGRGGMAEVHRVCFEEPFWIDMYEVTNAQFAAFGG